MASRTESRVSIGSIAVSAYEIPTDFPESDGTFAWNKTTLVIAEPEAGGVRAIGYSYAPAAAAQFIAAKLAKVVRGRDPMDIPGAWAAMVHEVRNDGRPGIASMAIAAVDNALWDLKGRLLKLPVAKLIGLAHEGVQAYGSGGFTSYSVEQLRKQLGGWAQRGFRAVKMKVGTHPEDDLRRAVAAREAVGNAVQLYVDANGAYTRKQALEFARRYRDLGVTWFEEPVSSDDLGGLHLIRDQGPPGLDIAAGEYGYDLVYFRRMLEAGAVDVLQADATRCAGITEFLRAGALAAAHNIPLSAHTAPSLHTHACCGAMPSYNIEYFHDHERIEHMVFDGALTPSDGVLKPDLSRPGLGLDFKRTDAARYEIYRSQGNEE